MRALLVALMLVSVPCGVRAQGVQDWRLCRAVDADHLVIPGCTRLIEQNNLSRGDRAIAYAFRGTAHWRQRDFDEAIADEYHDLKRRIFGFLVEIIDVSQLTKMDHDQARAEIRSRASLPIHPCAPPEDSCWWN